MSLDLVSFSKRFHFMKRSDSNLMLYCLMFIMRGLIPHKAYNIFKWLTHKNIILEILSKKVHQNPMLKQNMNTK